MAMVLWDINHMSTPDDSTEEEEPPNEILVVQTRSKGPITQNQLIIAQDPKKPEKPTSSTQSNPLLSSTPKFQTHEVSKLEYNVVEDLKNMKENIFVMDL